VGKWAVLLAVIMIATLLMACGAPEEPAKETLPVVTPSPIPEVSSDNSYLTPNPVENSLPIYGSIIEFGLHIPISFDGHQKRAYGPTGILPTFNQLVMFNINYKETVPENIIGDLADSWETSEDGTEIIFHLHPGVKWHDGVPFTADDVIYSLDKMTDVNRSAISDWFPAYESSEKIDDNTVKVHLKYASASFMINLAAGESVIQAKHLAGTDDQSAEFMVGTGPYILDDYKTRVHLKWRRNPDYWKYDQYGNQLPYMDGIIFYEADGSVTSDMLVGRRMDIRSTTTGAATTDTYEYLKDGAPELLWQKRDKEWGAVMYFNLNHSPLDDIRVRRAMGLVVDEESLIIGYCGDAMFGVTDIGLLPPSFGLPKEEIMELMGWDKPKDERVAEAQRLMAEAGYPDGFELNMLSRFGAQTMMGLSLIYEAALRTNLKIDPVVTGPSDIEIHKRLDEDNYDLYTHELNIGLDPVRLKTYFGTDGYANYSGYSNPELDRMLAELDYIIDPVKRRDAIWEIERILLTDLPALPTGCFIANYMPYYPHVKNIRWGAMAYSSICRLEDVWIDESLRVK
jgi:peptide/nickel transport system substrate-binding protein